MSERGRVIGVGFRCCYTYFLTRDNGILIHGPHLSCKYVIRRKDHSVGQCEE